jgi:outer membrane biogenesis lipoprotein LolB
MKVFFIALCVLVLSACASTQEKSSLASSDAAIQSQATDAGAAGYYSDVDWDYVKKVEKLAIRRGVMVKWVQMPRKKETPVTNNP